MRKFWLLLLIIICVGISLSLYLKQQREQEQLAFLVPVQVPEAAVTENSAVVTWHWTTARPEPAGIVDYNLYINDWAAGSTKDWNYGTPGMPRLALSKNKVTDTWEQRNQCTLTGLESYTYYNLYLEPVLADGRTLPRSMLEFNTLPGGENLSVMEYGVLGEDSTDDTEMLQRIINLCPSGGRVVLRRGRYFAGPLRLHGQMTLELKEGAVLTALPPVTKNPAAVLPLPDVPLALFNCAGGAQVRLTGKGKLVSGGYPLLACSKTTNLYIKDLSLQAREPQEKILSLRACQGVALNGLRMENAGPGSVDLTDSSELLLVNYRLP